MSEQDPIAWRQGAERAVVTGRSARWYERVFDIQPDELVLDVGAGESPYNPPDATIIRADYGYHEPSEEAPDKGVACYAQQLPFPDETFDRTVASYSCYWLDDASTQPTLEEMLRVTRPGGMVEIVPVRKIIQHRRAANDFAKEHELAMRRMPLLIGNMQFLLAACIPSAGLSFLHGAKTGIVVTGSVAGVVVGHTKTAFSVGIPRTEALSSPNERTQFSTELLSSLAINATFERWVNNTLVNRRAD